MTRNYGVLHGQYSTAWKYGVVQNTFFFKKVYTKWLQRVLEPQPFIE